MTVSTEIAPLTEVPNKLIFSSKNAGMHGSM